MGKDGEEELFCLELEGGNIICGITGRTDEE